MHNYSDKKRSLGLLEKVSIYLQIKAVTIGISLVLIGLTGGVIFFPQTSGFSGNRFPKTAPVTTGNLISRTPTNTMLGKHYIYKFIYSYSLPSGDIITDKSYAVGTQNNLDSVLTIEYLAEQPEISRIKGMQRGQINYWNLYLFVALFMGGIICLLWGLKKVLFTIKKLEYWSIAKAKFISKIGTGKYTIYMNRKEYFKMQFSYMVHNKKYTTTVTTAMPETLLGKSTKLLIYNEHTPSECLLIGTQGRKVQQYFQRLAK